MVRIEGVDLPGWPSGPVDLDNVQRRRKGDNIRVQTVRYTLEETG